MATDYSALIASIGFETLLVDTEDPIEINSSSRQLVIPVNFNKQVAVEYDENANEISFVCDKAIEGYDVLNCEKAYVKWQNFASGVDGVYEITDRAQHESLADKMTFHWIVEKAMTTKAGAISFSVGFYDFAEGETEPVVIYQWQTNPCSELAIGAGLFNETIDSEEFVVGEVDLSDIEGKTFEGLTDVDASIVVDLKTKKVTIPNGFETKVAQAGDCGSTVITFELTEEGDFNFAAAGLKVVKWTNGRNLSGYDGLIADTTGTKLRWIPKPDFTEFEGAAKFQISLITLDSDGVTVINRWNSEICDKLNIGASIYNADLDVPTTLDYATIYGLDNAEDWTL